MRRHRTTFSTSLPPLLSLSFPFLSSVTVLPQTETPLHTSSAPCGTQRCSAPRVRAKRSCFLSNVQKWITVLMSCLRDWSHDLRPFWVSSTCRETQRSRQRRRRRIYSTMISSFLTFPLTYSVSRPTVKWGVLIYLPTLSPFPSFSFCLPLTPSCPLFYPHTHTHTHTHTSHTSYFP